MFFVVLVCLEGEHVVICGPCRSVKESEYIGVDPGRDLYFWTTARTPPYGPIKTGVMSGLSDPSESST